MRRSRVRAVVAGFTALAATSFFWVAAAPSQGDTLSATISKVGWWSQDPTAQKQPDGGFQVTLTAAGPQSVAAVEITLGEAQSVTSATLTLTETNNVAGPNGPALQACVASSSTWKADNPGQWSDQPPNDCSRSVALQRDATASPVVYKGNISSLVNAGGPSDIMILPVAAPVAGLADPGFQVTVSKAEVAAEGTTSAGSTTDNSSSFSFDSSGSSGSSSGSSATSSSGSSGSSGSGFSSPSGSSSFAFPSSPQSATAAPVTPAAPAVAPPSAPSTPAPASPPPPLSGAATSAAAGRGPHHTRPWGRMIVFLPLAILVGLGAAVVKRSENLSDVPLLGMVLGVWDPER